MCSPDCLTGRAETAELSRVWIYTEQYLTARVSFWPYQISTIQDNCCRCPVRSFRQGHWLIGPWAHEVDLGSHNVHGMASALHISSCIFFITPTCPTQHARNVGSTLIQPWNYRLWPNVNVVSKLTQGHVPLCVVSTCLHVYIPLVICNIRSPRWSATQLWF